MARLLPFRMAPVLIAAVLPLALALGGCVAPLDVAAVGGGAEISQNQDGATCETFAAPADQVHAATRKALADMGIRVDADRRGGTSRTITAHATDRQIRIEIDAQDPTTTCLRVVASENAAFRDSATATEIVIQTAQALDSLEAARARPAGPKA